MSDIAIRADHLGKRYRIGKRERYKTLRETLTGAACGPFRALHSLFRPSANESSAASDTTLWALRDISFEVKHGEVVGIIGRNGAGKSTLLKILSRITEPTEGFVDISGRVGSLLEVGTGFHNELTGRENIFLNGAILGMQRREIERKFDEIVAFSEVEKFLDTPVKFYSSGMYMRLAFAVAAHLEPEILIVDEVLAVGDFDFQRKCLGKMRNVSSSGRTVVFVSHNMSAVQYLCGRAILLDSGGIIAEGLTAATIGTYLNLSGANTSERVWDSDNAPGFQNGAVRLRSIRVCDQEGVSRKTFDVKGPVVLEIEYLVSSDKYSLNAHLYFTNEAGTRLFVSMDNVDSPWRNCAQPAGLYRSRCTIPPNFLNEGTVRVEYLVCTRPTTEHFVSVPDAIVFQITDDKDEAGVRGNWVRDWPESAIRPRLQWIVQRIAEEPNAP